MNGLSLSIPMPEMARDRRTGSLISGLMKKRTFPFKVIFTKTKGDMHAYFQEKALRSGYRKIITVGGDGTLNEVVNGIFTNDYMSCHRYLPCTNSCRNRQ